MIYVPIENKILKNFFCIFYIFIFLKIFLPFLYLKEKDESMQIMSKKKS